MKTLIFNGSPRKHGDTAQLLACFKQQLLGEVQEIRCYDAGIGPCIDCRYCWTHRGCAVQDAMQALYPEIEAADHLVIASPIHFSELSGPLLVVAGRLQTYFCASRFRNEQVITNPKKGGVLLTGGGNGDLMIAYKTAVRVLHHIGVVGEIPLISSFDTDRVPAGKDPAALAGVTALADYFNQSSDDSKGQE